MDTKEIINALNEKTGNKYSFVFKDATVSPSDGSCLLELYYKDGVILSFDERKESADFIRSKLPSGFEYKVKFIKNFVTKDTIIPKIDEFFAKNMPSVIHEVQSLEKTESGFSFVLSIDDKTYEYFLNKDGEKKLKEFLEKSFFMKFDFETKMKQMKEETEEPVALVFEEKEQNMDDRVIEISGVEVLIGDVIEEMPKYIKDIAGKEAQDICVCGQVKFLKENSYERKKKESAPSKDGVDELLSEPSLRYYYKWTLEGFTGSMKCVYFSNKNTLEAIRTLEDGQEIVVVGDIEKDKFGDSYSMKVKRISKCVRPDGFEEKIDYKTENAEYKFVFPERIEITAQVDLFGALEEVIPPYLQTHDVVVFDFETTGLNVGEGHKIIEIGAVKIENGKIKDRFMCMIDPEMHIPEESTKIHGIVDEDVQGAPKIEEAIQDFYKYTRGCVLCGHNIEFDFGFLNKYGKECRYNFDNEQLDTLALAKMYVKGAKNYKLGTLCEKFGIVLDNAHRAVYDARATAELLIKLAENIEA